MVGNDFMSLESMSYSQASARPKRNAEIMESKLIMDQATKSDEIILF